MRVILIVYFFSITLSGWSQTYPIPVPGQLPTTAFPVCGTSSFYQSIVPFAQAQEIQVPGCGLYPVVSPFWYSFTCFASGTLGFLITPNRITDDYDWMLFDITGHDPGDVFSNISLVVIGDWSGSSGLTGTRNGGAKKTQCASAPNANEPRYTIMPNLIQGHNYLLLVSHYTDNQSGYSLSFSGGTADITDTLTAHLKSVSVDCTRQTLTVVLNKKMKCGSLSPNGSDFIIASNPVSVITASVMNCNNGFDMDSFRLTTSAPLPTGNYSLVLRTGSDGNTLLDNCDKQMAVDDSISFTVLPAMPSPLDSLTSPACAPNSIQLVFSKPILCSSIAPDGSDFKISGSPDISITGASGFCNNGLTPSINIQLNAPIQIAGNYQITLVSGSDGNTIINECNLETPAGETISFSTKDTVSASFSYATSLGCSFDTIALNYLPANGVDQWLWNIDSTSQIKSLSPSLIYTVFGEKNVQHIVSNGFCSDTVTQAINLDNTLKASFQAPEQVCPKNTVSFQNTSVGNIISWSWDFGDGISSDQQSPSPVLFPDTREGKTYTVRLAAKNNLGCIDTFSTQIYKMQSCYITVPNAFTPNGDGKNDFLYPLNAFSVSDLEFEVFNRFGQLVFESRDYTRKWDGTINGKPQDFGTYVWTLRYTDASGRKFFLRGTSVLIR